MIGNFDDETIFPHELLLTDTEVSKICEAFANVSLANTKFAKGQLSKIEQPGGFIFPAFIWVSPDSALTKSLLSAKSLVKLVTKSLEKEKMWVLQF